MEKPILVTCAQGTVGSRVVRCLRAGGHPVRPGVHGTVPNERCVTGEPLPVECDFDRPDTLARAMHEVQSVVLITPVCPASVDYAGRFIELAKRAGIRRIVRLSGAVAADQTGVVLGRWHREVETLLTGSGLEYVIVRPTLFMQNFVNYYRPDALGYFYLPMGMARVNFIDAVDVAEVIAHVAQPSGPCTSETLLATGPHGLTAVNVATALSEAAGRPVQPGNLAPKQVAIAMRLMGLPGWAVHVFKEIHELVGAGFYDVADPLVRQVCAREPNSFSFFAGGEAVKFRRSRSGLVTSLAARLLGRFVSG